MSENGIAWLETKEERQIAKLNLAAEKRGETYDINLLPTKYSGNDVIDNENIGGLQPHRPWGSAGQNPNSVTAMFASVNDGGYGYWTNNGTQTTPSSFGGLVNMVSYNFPNGSTGTPYTLAGGYALSPLIDNLGSNEITINIWFYPTANGIQVVSEYGTQSPSAGYHYTMLEIDSSGYIHGRFWPNGGIGIVTSNTVMLNAWNHVWYTNNASGYEQLQLNGGQIATQTVLPRSGPGSSSFAFGVTDATDLDGNYATTRLAFQGKIGYFRYDNNATVGSVYTSTQSKYTPTAYTVRQFLYGYAPGSGNSSLYVLDSDYPLASIIPPGATATINGTQVTVANNNPSTSVYFNGASGRVIDFVGNTGNIDSGTTVNFTW